MPEVPKSKRKVDREFLDTFHQMRCLVCNRQGCDPAHVRTRAAGGDDDHDGVIPLCRVHHVQQGQIGFFRFCEKYPKVRLELEARGWAFDQKKSLKRI
jgi:hypothetical protein